MRLLVSLLFIAIVIASAPAQQSKPDTQQAQPAEQKSSKKQPAQKQPPQQKTEEPSPKAAEPAPQPAPKAGDDKDKKEEKYDMTEVAPVVTHHQITMGRLKPKCFSLPIRSMGRKGPGAL
jgi:hypothetical protein